MPMTERKRDPASIQFLDHEPRFDQGRPTVVLQLLFLQQVRHGEAEWKTKTGFHKLSPLKVDRHGGVGDEHPHDDRTPAASV